MVTVDEIRQAQQAVGPATVLAIGTANPPNCFDQSSYPDYFFRVTNSEHKIELMQKFRRMCDKTMIKKRYFHLTEEILLWFHAPCETEFDVLLAQALFGDGASAVVVGSDPIILIERPLFEIVFATQTLLPNSGYALSGDLNEAGLIAHIHKDIPMLISKNIERILLEAFQPLGISDWNSIFWVTHAGGRAILDQIESKLSLKPEKLKATRNVLSDYGNIASASVLFVLDEMRKSSIRAGLGTTGEGLHWGVLFGFGPGLTIETVLLRSVSV